MFPAKARVAPEESGTYHAANTFMTVWMPPHVTSWGLTFSKAGELPLVESMHRDSFSELQGLRAGDVLCKVNGKRITDRRHAIELLAPTSSHNCGGSHFSLSVWRDGGQFGCPPPRAPAGGHFVTETCRSLPFGPWTYSRIVYEAPDHTYWTFAGFKVAEASRLVRRNPVPTKKESDRRSTDVDRASDVSVASTVADQAAQVATRAAAPPRDFRLCPPAGIELSS